MIARRRLYKAPPQRELSDEDRATLAAGGTLAPTAAPGGIAGTGVTVLTQAKPAPPPEAPGAYKKKSGESGGDQNPNINMIPRPFVSPKFARVP